jgi:hypothetical protein
MSVCVSVNITVCILCIRDVSKGGIWSFSIFRVPPLLLEKIERAAIWEESVMERTYIIIALQFSEPTRLEKNVKLCTIV